MTEREKDDWTKSMRCVLEGYSECAAKIPEACICRQMPKDMYLERLKRSNGELSMI